APGVLLRGGGQLRAGRLLGGGRDGGVGTGVEVGQVVVGITRRWRGVPRLGRGCGLRLRCRCGGPVDGQGDGDARRNGGGRGGAAPASSRHWTAPSGPRVRGRCCHAVAMWRSGVVGVVKYEISMSSVTLVSGFGLNFPVFGKP